MQKVKQLLITLGLITGVGLAVLPAANVSAIEVFKGCTSGQVCASKGDQAPSLIKNVINTLLYVLGFIAVIFVVIGGIRYTTSNGNSTQTKEAKDTILYAVVGLVVAILSYTIVNFVLGRF